MTIICARTSQIHDDRLNIINASWYHDYRPTSVKFSLGKVVEKFVMEKISQSMVYAKYDLYIILIFVAIQHET